MKTKTTTTDRAEKATGGKPSAEALAQPTDRDTRADQRPRLLYPDLEEHVPEDCHTTDDPPAYGKRSRMADG